MAEPTSTVECLHPMEQRNSETILFHPRDVGPGGSHGAEGRSGATSQAEDLQCWRGMGKGECIQPQGHEPNKHE
jgi:hypothetical protein